METQKRVLAVHDISCVGKCSLTVALPIISAAGVECSILPTSVLSTHTSGFTGFTFKDLTDEITPITKHWSSLNLTFDAIYTGYLGSFAQIELIKKLFDDFRTENTVICVDPVMGDNGAFYSLFDEEFARSMATLCGKADLIMPNLTEAAFMTGLPYEEKNYSKDYVLSMIHALHQLGTTKVVLTGISFDPTKLGAVTSDMLTGEIDYLMNDKIDGYFHGTGDVFGSALVGALTNDKTLKEATQIAVDFTLASIRRTQKTDTESLYGVCFEKELPFYIDLMK